VQHQKVRPNYSTKQSLSPLVLIIEKFKATPGYVTVLKKLAAERDSIGIGDLIARLRSHEGKPAPGSGITYPPKIGRPLDDFERVIKEIESQETLGNIDYTRGATKEER
jgi:hypothetical protein